MTKLLIISAFTILFVSGLKGQPPTGANYGDLSAVDIFLSKESEKNKKVSLDYFAKEIKQRPTEKAYIICYSDAKSKLLTAEQMCKWIRNYLQKKKKLNSHQFVILLGGTLPRGWTELYFVPSGAMPPQPSPPR